MSSGFICYQIYWASSMDTAALLTLTLFLLIVYRVYCILSPKPTKQMMQCQGILGPYPKLLLGNLLDMKKITQNASKNHNFPVTHNLEPRFFPYFVQWKKAYGKSFVYWLGSEAVLYVQQPELLQEIASSGSLNWGRPAFLKNDRYPLFGNGLIMAEDQDWLHQRRIVGQALTAEKVKGLFATVMEASLPVVNKWSRRVMEGGQSGVEIEVDGDLENITTHVISKLLFGSSYEKGFVILAKLRALQQALFKSIRLVGVPGSRFISRVGNRKAWKLGKEVNVLIMEIINARLESNTTGLGDDLLGLLLKEVRHGKGLTMQDVVDECKTLLLAGQETTKLSLTWTLMLLALNPHWQQRVREEVKEITRGADPDVDMLSKMKIMTMVLNESMRLYPPVAYTVRQAKQDLHVGNLKIPKGMSVFINIVGMHEDPDTWARDDVYEFKPERFSNGESSKRNSGFMPFGFGGRVCIGEKMARMEQRAILSMIISKFTFSISPNYTHSPSFLLSIMPSNGMQLLFALVD
uniref:Cytochrome P450 n=1 Tax=Araucaria cunninghamii TaxID=56994 RepID=A0A0D6R745_ARACU